MNAFAATESDLALRIRRTLGGSARRMGTPARVLAVVLLCPLAAVTLPSCGTISKVSKGAAESSKKNISIVVDQDGNMKLNDKPVTFATLKEELQAKRQQLDNTTMIFIQGDEHATHSQIVQIMDIARQVGLVNQIIATEPQPAKYKGAAKPSRDDGIWREALSTDPDEWSDELKAQLLALHHPGSHIEAGSTTEEIVEEIRRMVFVEEVRQRMPWQEATDPDEWPEELKAQLRALKPIVPTISYEITTATSAELAIYDVAGQHVRTFALGHQSPGKHSIIWDGRDDAGRERSDGLYFYRLKTEDAEAEVVGKTMLVR